MMWIPSRNSTDSLKLKCLTTITISMVLKFISHLKHLAKFVLGFAPVINSEHFGQRNLKYPSDIFDGISRTSAINVAIGISFRSLLNILFEYSFLIFTSYGMRKSLIVSLTIFSSIFLIFFDAAFIKHAVAILLICLGIPPE